ncbi:hypothetical protein [Rhodococcoides fascians]|uniref:hypothetical protein n=1 Tax=Rhodococcoides fascians TaxID=1828 RepID=UPI0012D2CD66|nr:hypothetical protein [Rhodococcus fascians]
MTERHCPHCNTAVDSTVPVGQPDNRPDPGDVNVCVYCAGVSVFTADGLRKPTLDEASEFLLEPAVRRAVRTVESIILKRAL